MRKIWYVVSKSQLDFRNFLELFDIELQNARRITESVHIIGLKTGTPIVFLRAESYDSTFLDIARIVRQKQLRAITVTL